MSSTTTRTGPTLSRSVAAGALAVSMLGFAACSSSGSSTASPTSGDVKVASSGPLALKGVCPSTVVMQQDWQPEAEQGAMYTLVGNGYTVDTDKKTVTGPLVVDGTDTGVKIQVRSGGPAVNFQPVPALMYLDPSILIGAVNTDAAISASAKQPTVAVTSQMTISPQIIMWDPASHPGAKTIKQAAADGAPVVTSGDLLSGILVQKGIIKQSQVDTSYQGTPQRFVSDPKILQQGFATAEPYIYEHEVAQWNKPVSYQLMSDVGYSIYPEPIAVRKADVTKQAACLKKLVPIMQQAQIDFLTSPAHGIAVILDLVAKYNTGWTYTKGDADYSVKEQKALKIVTNDPQSGVFGKLDPARVASTVKNFTPFLVKDGSLTQAQADAIDPTSLYTNTFIDTSIKMK